MIAKGSIVRYTQNNGKFWNGKLLFVHECREDKVIVYTERNPKGKWQTTSVPLKDVEEVR